MSNKLIALCFLVLSGTLLVAGERQESLERELLNKNELVNMLKIKTASQEEQIDQFEKLVEQLRSELKTLRDQRNKCQSTDCLCQGTQTHTISLPGSTPFAVSCDSTLVSPGWTVILRRINGAVDFNRNWRAYQQGFGDLQTEFFIGLDKLHAITKSQPYELYIHLENAKGEKRFARYDSFAIGNEAASYEITSLGNYTGNAGDGMVHHKHMKFSTFDEDNDNSDRNCADENSSGWWFNNCFKCNLNGQYNSGFYWFPWQRNLLKSAQVMIRPIEQ